MGRLIMGGMRAGAVVVVVLVAIVACWNPGPGSDLPGLGGAPPVATAEWARSVDAASGSVFNAVAHDASGNAYAVGYQAGESTFDYGTGVTATGGTGTAERAVMVKYNSAGAAQWTRSGGGSNVTLYLAVALDGDGNPHVAGTQNGNSPVPYGNGVSATAATTGVNASVVRYSAAGAAQWARTTTAGTQSSLFQGISIVPSGELYAVGYQAGNQPYEYGPGVSATSTSVGNNVVIVRFEP